MHSKTIVSVKLCLKSCSMKKHPSSVNHKNYQKLSFSLLGIFNDTRLFYFWFKINIYNSCHLTLCSRISIYCLVYLKSHHPVCKYCVEVNTCNEATSCMAPLSYILSSIFYIQAYILDCWERLCFGNPWIFHTVMYFSSQHSRLVRHGAIFRADGWVYAGG